MPRFTLSATTHTAMQAQIAAINARLARPGSAAITAGDLRVHDAPAAHGGTQARLPESAVLQRLSWSGEPEWPMIHAHFEAPAQAAEVWTTGLHTSTLRRLSRRLGLRQTWGI